MEDGGEGPPFIIKRKKKEKTTKITSHNPNFHSNSLSQCKVTILMMPMNKLWKFTSNLKLNPTLKTKQKKKDREDY